MHMRITKFDALFDNNPRTQTNSYREQNSYDDHWQNQVNFVNSCNVTNHLPIPPSLLSILPTPHHTQPISLIYLVLQEKF
jgi:hypothetical protein